MLQEPRRPQNGRRAGAGIPGLLPALGDDPREGRYGVSGCAFGSIFTIQRPLYMSFT